MQHLRVAITALIAVLMLTVSTFAVDKTPRNEKEQKKEVPATSPREPRTKNRDSAQKSHKRSDKSYDKFIDQNQDGIDDRIDNKQKPPRQKADSTKHESPNP